MTDSSPVPTLTDLLDQRNWLAGLARSLVHDAHAAEDAAQETWLRAFTHRVTLREPRAWLATVLSNVVRQRQRGDGRRRLREHASARADTTIADANERFEVQRAVAAAVQALDEPFRTTVLLHHFEGHSLADLARLQGVPAGTVRWRLHRAHALLRERLRGSFGDQNWRASLLLLCLPRRSAAVLPLFAAAVLLLGSAMLWFSPWSDKAPTAAPAAAARHTVAAAGTAHDVDDAPTPAARTEVPTAPAVAAATPAADRRATVEATIVDADGAPLGDARLALTSMKAAAVRSGLSHLEVPADALHRLAPPAASRPDGRVRLELRADRELLALLPETTPADLVAEVLFSITADGHAPELRTTHLAPGDTVSLGAIALQRLAALAGLVQFADGTPAVGATVSVLYPPLPQFPEQLAHQQFAGNGDARTTAGDDGSFRLTAVRTGIGLLWASLPGHTSAFATVDVPTAGLAAPPLVLRPATTSPRPTYEKKVAVYVVDADGKPVAGARVDYRWDGARGQLSAGMTRTRSDGRVTVDLWQGCTERPVRLAVSAMHDKPLLGPVGLDVPLHDDDEVKLVLPPAATCAVRVVDHDGIAIPAFTATWEALAPHVGEAFAPGQQGHATLLAPIVPATLTVVAAGFLPQTQRLEPGTAAVAVALPRHRGISGRVVAAGKPVAGALVSMLQCDHPVLRNGFRSEGERRGHFDATCDGEGRFHVDQLSPATLRLLVRAPGRANLVTPPHPFDPARGWNDLELVLGDGGTLEGFVRDADGVPCPRVWVAINDFFGDARTVLTDAEGRYRGTNLRAGGYEVRTTDKGITDDDTSMIVDRSLATTTVHADCEVRDGEATRWDVLASRGRIRGRLQAQGFSPRGWRASLQRDHDRKQRERPEVLGDDGRFTLGTAHEGPHLVVLQAPGGPLGNVTMTIRLDVQPGEQPLVVPLALAPTQGIAAGGSGTAWTALSQTRGDTTVSVPVALDATTLAFTAVLAPVGEVVVRQGTSTGSVELVRHIVAPR